MINLYISALHNLALKEKLGSLEPKVGRRRLVGFFEVLKRNQYPLEITDLC